MSVDIKRPCAILAIIYFWGALVLCNIDIARNLMCCVPYSWAKLSAIEFSTMLIKKAEPMEWSSYLVCANTHIREWEFEHENLHHSTLSLLSLSLLWLWRDGLTKKKLSLVCASRVDVVGAHSHYTRLNCFGEKRKPDKFFFHIQFSHSTNVSQSEQTWEEFYPRKKKSPFFLSAIKQRAVSLIQYNKFSPVSAQQESARERERRKRKIDFSAILSTNI